MKGKLGRVVFRKINGRIIPIKISNVGDKVADANSFAGTKHRTIKAALPSGERVGTLHLQVPKKGNHGILLGVEVRKEFRKRGISKNLFKRASDFLARAGKKFLRSDSIQHPAQVKIRQGSGNLYKAGGKLKRATKYVADQYGAYGENSKKITSKEALQILKNNFKGQNITATTMIKRKKK